MALAALVCISCGQVYRPVVIPISVTPPNPANFHAVFGISSNVTYNPGTALQIDVSGDSNIGQATMGVSPTHAAALPNNSRVFVASSGSLFSGESDVVTGFTPAFDSSIATGLGALTTITLPSGSLPVFLNTSQNNRLYVANYGTNSVSALNPATGVISLTGAVGASPVALVETPDASNLYVVNQGDNTVTDLSPTDLTALAIIPVGSSPVWATTRIDGQFVYVVTQGDGQLYTIQTTTNAIVSNQSVGGPGANFALYDKGLNRLYVTNPTAGAVYVFDATTASPTLMATISMTTGANAPCPTGCSPVSITALPNGTTFYVASYQTAAACPDPTIGVSHPCVIPRLTIYDALTFAVKPAATSRLAPSLSLLMEPQFGAAQYAVPAVSTCAAVAPYTPNSTRFRMFTVSAVDSSHVYVSVCDAGSIADINTTTSSITTSGSNTPNTLVADVPAPFSAAAAGVNNEPPPQNPIFLLTGQ
jgi:YVTN family beta-propeller protein